MLIALNILTHTNYHLDNILRDKQLHLNWFNFHTISNCYTVCPKLNSIIATRLFLGIQSW